MCKTHAASAGPRQKPGLSIAIDGEWYDLEKWAKYHPGGKSILKTFNGHDATDHFYSLHSKEAINKLKKMRPMETKEAVPETEAIDASFRQLRAKLTTDGWFERDAVSEVRLVTPILGMAALGTYLSYSHPVTAVVLIAVAMQQAGWLGHDMTHSKESDYCEYMGNVMSAVINGFNRAWWSTKHNTHHVMTNHVGVDPDIDLAPALFLWSPSKGVDSHMRKYQHLYALPLYSLLYVSWRQQSIQRAVFDRDYVMLAKLAIGYGWLATLPLSVSIASIILGGLLVAAVVTQSHEMEDMRFTDKPSSFCVTQFEGTTDIICPDPVTEYLFGGMQYQLTHHLFPTLPRYKYSTLWPIVKQWATNNGLTYKRTGIVDICKLHYKHLKEKANAEAEDIPGAVAGGWGSTLQEDAW